MELHWRIHGRPVYRILCRPLCLINGDILSDIYLRVPFVWTLILRKQHLPCQRRVSNPYGWYISVYLNRPPPEEGSIPGTGPNPHPQAENSMPNTKNLLPSLVVAGKVRISGLITLRKTKPFRLSTVGCCFIR